MKSFLNSAGIDVETGDVDIDTIENLSEKEYVRATQLEQGDISVVMPFADEEDCKVIAKFIYDKQNEIANDVTYTCSPDAEPVLGELIDGNVINSIDYFKCFEFLLYFIMDF